MRLLAFTPTRFWPADGRQEARVAADTPGPVEFRSAAGRVTVDLPAGESVVALPSQPGLTAMEVRVAAGEWERRPWEPGRRWDVVVMPTGHVDVYSSATYDKTPEEHAVMLDAALDLCARHDGYRYQIEHLLAVVEYRELRPGRYAELVDRLREGRLGVGAQGSGLHHGEATGEELVQAHLALGRRVGVVPNCGYTCDVPHATAQYRQLLARLGIPRWIYSPNRFPAPGGFYGVDVLVRRLPPLGRAVAPDGSAVTTWIPPVHYGTDQERCGLTAADTEATRGALDAALDRLEAEDDGWIADVYPLEASDGDNIAPCGALVEAVEAWRARYAWPRLRFGTATDVFDAIEGAERAGVVLPEWEGEIGDTWAWVAANQAPLNAIAREAARLVVAAQVSAAVTGAEFPAACDEAFAALAKFESHDWWYAGDEVMGVPDLAKAEFARAAREAAVRALDPTRPGGGALLDTSGVDRARVVVTTAGPGPTCGALLDTSGVDGPRVVAGAAAGQAVPGELAAAHFDPRPSSPALLTDAPRVPLVVGVRYLDAFEALDGGDGDAGDASPSLRRLEPSVLENAHYRVVFGPEGVTSLVDKPLDLELAAAPLARVLVATPQGEAAGMGFMNTREWAQEEMRKSLAEWVAWEGVAAESWTGAEFGATLWHGRVGESPASLAVVLWDALPRVDLTVCVDWDGKPWFARLFADFDLALGELRDACYGVPFGSVRAGDEAPIGPATLRMAGTWVALAGSDAAAVIASADTGIVALGDPARTLADLAVPDAPGRTRASFVLADTGAPSPLVQGGRLVARFSLASRARPFAPGEAARFAAAFTAPLLRVAAPSPGWRVEPAFVIPTVLAPARDGDGVILRVVECDGVAARVTVEPPFAVAEVREVRPDEADLGPVTFPLPVGPHEIRTLRFRPSPKAF